MLSLLSNRGDNGRCYFQQKVYFGLMGAIMSKVHSIMLYQFHSVFKSRIAERMTAVKRSDSAGVVIKCRKLQKSVLPLNVDVISHY